MWTQSFIDPMISAVALPPGEAQRVRQAFLATKPRQSKAKLNPTNFALDLLWGAQGRLLAKRYPDKAQLSGVREHALLIMPVQAKVELSGISYPVRVQHAAPLSEALVSVALSSPLENFLSEASSLELATKAEAEQQLAQLSQELTRASSTNGFPLEEMQSFLSNALRKPTRLDYAIERIQSHTAQLLQRAREATDLQELLAQQGFQSYAEHFPVARGLKRRLTLYVGPTNSGKTYHALNHLAEAEDGAYLAPLRLLALEGQEELEKRGRPTSFLTGEERDLRADARFVSSTIEMLDLRRTLGAVVIDEAQLLADHDRGWAWSAAIIGAPAEHVVMTGSPDVVPIIEALAKYLKEPLEIKHMERFTPLRVMPAPSRLDALASGTAIICFSRRDCLGLKQMLEEQHRVAVIYGNLSPQVRREEARRFRSGEADILVATDAIALGLNLPIKTVLFYTLNKWNGQREITLSPQEIRQIGGRAGRYGQSDEGLVGAFSRRELRLVQASLSQSVPPQQLRIRVRPSLSHLTAMQERLGTVKLATLLDVFQRRMRFDDPILVPANLSEMRHLAAITDEFSLSLEEKFTFACAPFDAKNSVMQEALRRWIKSYAKEERVRLERDIPAQWATTTAEDQDDLYQAEQEVKLLTAYAWLSFRFPAFFLDGDGCESQRQILNGFIERTLRTKGLARRCSSCRQGLPPLHPFSICDKCHHGTWDDECLPHGQ